MPRAGLEPTIIDEAPTLNQTLDKSMYQSNKENPVSQSDKLFTKKNGINFMHLNIHYLFPKFDEIKHLLDENNEIDVLGLGETFLSSSFSDSEFQLKNYQLFRRDRQSNGGGIVVYVKSNYPCIQRHDLEIDSVESIWLEFKCEKQKSFIVGYVYRPPSSAASWNTDMEKILEKVYCQNKEIILFGDINYNFVNSETSNVTWNNITNAFNLTQLVDKPTRVTSTTSTIIDHVYSNYPCDITDINVPVLSLSDHFPVCFTRKANAKNSVKKGPLHQKINYRSLSNFNEASFIDDLEMQPWSDIDQLNDPDSAIDLFIKLFSNVLNSHAPNKQKRVKYIQQPDWFNSNITAAIKKRDLAKKANDVPQYKFWREEVKKVIVKSKKENCTQTINEKDRNPKKLWKNLSDLIGKSNTQQHTNYINDDNGNPIMDHQESAEAFNSFFCNIFQRVDSVTTITDQNKTILKEHVAKHLEDSVQFEIPPITEQFIKKSLSALDERKATGLDGINAKFLKMSASVISKPLEKVFNMSIEKGTFPSIFKEAKVTPIFKKGSKSDKNNYRPISILPVLSKIYEKHVSNHLQNFLEENNLIHTQQSGFRKKHNCETALTATIDNWIKAIDENKIVGSIFLDLTKAFDLVNHSLLLNKLQLYQFSSKSQKWFASYLKDRSQRVCVSGKLSKSSAITSGVPQGSVLGPILFIMYINDLPLHLQNSTTDMFADDTTVSAIGKSVDEVQSTLQNELKVAESWCETNTMIPNAQKTKSMFISASRHVQNKVQTISNQNLLLQGQLIEKSSSEKLLGVHIDKHLSWKVHVENTLKKCNSLLYLLLRIRYFINVHVRKLFFNAYILPHLDYCCTIWGNCSKDLLDSMLKFQKRAARIILNKDYDYPSDELFKELKWMKFSDRVTYKKSLLVYMSINNIAPSYLNDKFTLSSNIHNRVLRSANNSELYVPKPRLEFSRKSLSYSGAKIWNGLPLYIREATTIQQFKCLYLQWHFSDES